MNSAAIREQQALDCMASAERYREPLLALSCKLAGSKEAGMDLYQQSLLNCHDAIQRRGFEGDRYEFYLRTAIKNLHRKEQDRQRRFVPFEEEPAPVPAAPVDALGELAQQVMEEARQRFDPADRLALRLHVDGHSCAEIAELIGKNDRTWVWRRLERMKRQLREIFQHHWDGLYQ